MKLRSNADRLQFSLGMSFFSFLFFSFKLLFTDLNNKRIVYDGIRLTSLCAFNYLSVSQSQDKLPFVKPSRRTSESKFFTLKISSSIYFQCIRSSSPQIYIHKHTGILSALQTPREKQLKMNGICGTE